MKKWIVGILLLASGIGVAYYFFPEKELPADRKIDKLVVIKSKRIMMAYSNGKVIKTYHVSLGRNPIGDKASEGDKRTPEGTYRINDRNPNSGYYKNLGVSYPNEQDRNEAKAKGLSPGGEIKIHGLRNGVGFIGKFHRLFDWTAGCIAVTNQELEELYQHVDIGTPIIIEP
jgi:murein L,D-transpeptidase YafK